MKPIKSNLSINLKFASKAITALLFGAIVSPMAQAGDIVKTNNATALDLADSWTNGLVPSATDIAVWDVNSGANSAPIGTGISIQGIRFDASTTGNQTINATGGGTLTNGSSGMDLANSTNTLAITAPIELNGDQTWTTETNGLLAAGTTQISYGGVISGTGVLTIDAGDKTARPKRRDAGEHLQRRFGHQERHVFRPGGERFRGRHHHAG